MKIARIVANDYKLDRFKMELTNNGFTDFEIISNTQITLKGTSLIRVKVADDKLNDIKKICDLVELHFKQSN